MGDFGKGLKSFKKSMKEEGKEVPADAAQAIESEAVSTEKDTTSHS